MLEALALVSVRILSPISTKTVGVGLAKANIGTRKHNGTRFVDRLAPGDRTASAVDANALAVLVLSL